MSHQMLDAHHRYNPQNSVVILLDAQRPCAESVLAHRFTDVSAQISRWRCTCQRYPVTRQPRRSLYTLSIPNICKLYALAYYSLLQRVREQWDSDGTRWFFFIASATKCRRSRISRSCGWRGKSKLCCKRQRGIVKYLCLGRRRSLHRNVRAPFEPARFRQLFFFSPSCLWVSLWQPSFLTTPLLFNLLGI